MRAVVIHAPHDLRVETVDVPEPGAGEVLVAVAAGGICGSDLHYYHHGGFGTVRIREPMILGHEASGRVIRIGHGVSRVAVGDLVAVSPSRPCNACRYCLEGRQSYCLDMRFYGSAMRFPHVQGAFRERLVAHESQCHPVAAGISEGEAAMAEPLAVCLHAIVRAGTVLGKRVLVTGGGPIGQLCLLAARRAGAAEIVLTDLASAPVGMARRLGAERALNITSDAAALEGYAAEKGHFDVALECSGSEAALGSILPVLRPGGIIVQVGLVAGAVASIPLNAIVAKEIELRGTFRFHAEFALAVELINKRLIDVAPLISATLPVDRAREAFELAGDRARAMKVQLSFA